ncbi:MAG: hypothetical protein OEN50_05680 [Deltaproteobacteria bacterium]|nr:hypothetical protein [Deltaproteobacteria bacterium]
MISAAAAGEDSPYKKNSSGIIRGARVPTATDTVIAYMEMTSVGTAITGTENPGGARMAGGAVFLTDRAVLSAAIIGVRVTSAAGKSGVTIIHDRVTSTARKTGAGTILGVGIDSVRITIDAAVDGGAILPIKTRDRGVHQTGSIGDGDEGYSDRSSIGGDFGIGGRMSLAAPPLARS